MNYVILLNRSPYLGMELTNRIRIRRVLGDAWRSYCRGALLFVDSEKQEAVIRRRYVGREHTREDTRFTYSKCDNIVWMPFLLTGD